MADINLVESSYSITVVPEQVTRAQSKINCGRCFCYPFREGCCLTLFSAYILAAGVVLLNSVAQKGFAVSNPSHAIGKFDGDSIYSVVFGVTFVAASLGGFVFIAKNAIQHGRETQIT